MEHMWRSISSQILNLPHLCRTVADHIFFPPHCFTCHIPIDAAQSICTQCTQSMHMISDPLCSHCGVPLPFAHQDSSLCSTCFATPPPYERARSIWVYDDHSAHLISRLKFSDHTHLASYIGSLMRLRAAEMITPDTWIVPVPLHPARLRQRRYNQSLLLARHVAKDGGIVIPDALIRTRNTQPQTTLDYHQRQSNVVGCFEVHPRYRQRMRGKHIVLVDDVRTTGATLHACTHAARHHGAAWVGVITAAVRLQPQDSFIQDA